MLFRAFLCPINLFSLPMSSAQHLLHLVMTFFSTRRRQQNSMSSNPGPRRIVERRGPMTCDDRLATGNGRTVWVVRLSSKVSVSCPFCSAVPQNGQWDLHNHPVAGKKTSYGDWCRLIKASRTPKSGTGNPRQTVIARNCEPNIALSKPRNNLQLDQILQ